MKIIICMFVYMFIYIFIYMLINSSIYITLGRHASTRIHGLINVLDRIARQAAQEWSTSKVKIPKYQKNQNLNTFKIDDHLKVLGQTDFRFEISILFYVVHHMSTIRFGTIWEMLAFSIVQWHSMRSNDIRWHSEALGCIRWHSMAFGW